MEEFDSIARKSIYAQAIGERVLEYLERFDPQQLSAVANARAIALVESIRLILEDSTLDDPSCFLRIEAIVDAYNDAGIHVSRHDW